MHAKLFAIIALVLCLGCPGFEITSSTFVSTQLQDGVALGVATDDAGTVLYMCGSGNTLSTHTGWFVSDQPLVTEEPLTLDGPDGWTATLTPRADDSGDYAGLELSSSDEEIAAELEGESNLAADIGVFHDGNASCRGGAVLFGDGAADVQGAACPDAVQIQVVPVDVGPEQFSGEIDNNGATDPVTMEPVSVADLL